MAEDGEEKVRWVQVGRLFDKGDGKFSVKLDAVPVGGEWDGWLTCFKDDDDRPQRRNGGQPKAQERLPDDEIPF
jgi:hypothetical protein